MINIFNKDLEKKDNMFKETFDELNAQIDNMTGEELYQWLLEIGVEFENMNNNNNKDEYECEFMFNWKELSPEEERKLIIESLLKAGVDVCVNGEEGITNPDVILENGKTIPLSEYNLFENIYMNKKELIL